MNIKTLLASFIFTTFLSFQNSNAQSFKDRYIWGFGITSLLDVDILPGSVEVVEGDVYTQDNGLVIQRDTSITEIEATLSFFSFTFLNRFILKEFSPNSSISLDIPMAIGLNSGSRYFIGCRVPVLLSYNFGNISTYESDKNKGISIGFGVEMMKYLFTQQPPPTKLISDPTSLNPPNNLFFYPISNISYRFWNKNNRAREFSLKIGYLPKADDEITYNGQEYFINNSHFNFKVTFIFYPRY